MENGQDPNKRREIQSSLSSIVESSDKWLARLKKREWQVRLASSFLTAGFIGVTVGIIALISQIVQGHLYTYFQQPNFGVNPIPIQLVTAFAIAGISALIAGLGSGIGTYLLLKRKHDARLKGLSSLVSEMKTKIEKNNDGEGITENALSLADRIMAILPQLVRNRDQDSLLFGAVAFVLVAIFFKNPLAAIVVAALVWLYFRYKTNKTYKQELSKFEEQKRIFDQQKKDFLDSL